MSALISNILRFWS